MRPLTPARRRVATLALLVAAAASAALAPALPLLLLGLLGLLRASTWGLLLLLAGSTGLLLGGAQPGALAAGAAGLLCFLLGLPLLWRTDRLATATATLLALALGVSLSLRAGPAPRAGSAAGEEPVIAGEADSIFGPASEPAPLRMVCTPPARGPETLYRRKVVYDFEDEVLEPLPFGPRFADRRRTSQRGDPELADLLHRRRALLRDCYRWARSGRPALEGRVELELRCTELGACTVLGAAPTMPGGEELGLCVREVLGGLDPISFSFTPTRARLAIRFAPSGQIPDLPPRRPPPPAPGAPPPPGVCFKVPVGAAEDHLERADPILDVDDHDPAQVDRERRRAHEEKLEAWRRGGRRGPRPTLVPRVISSTCSIAPASFTLRTIRRTFRGNLGTYRACYREALRRRPGLRGRVTLSATIDSGGNVAARVSSSEVTDPPLEGCLRRALEEVWFPPFGSTIAVASFPFLLEPAADTPLRPLVSGRPSEIEARAAALLERGDGEAALRSTSALLRQLGADDPRACTWRLGALESLLRIVPVEDPRVTAAVEVLVSELRGHPVGRSARHCLERSLPVLTEVATQPHRDVLHTNNAHLRRAERTYRQILDGLERFRAEPELVTLRYYHAEALFALRRYSEAATVYAEVARLAGKYAKEAAEAHEIARKHALATWPLGRN